MLAPDDRVTLLELLEPPLGYDLDAAAGFTYTLDLEALLTLPTAFALGSTDEDDADLTPLGLLHALQSYAGRLTVCCDASGIGLPPKARSGVFGFLEQSVLPVLAPRGGVFHPKAWIVRFSSPSADAVHRVLISSRNLTYDRSWDTVLRLEEAAEGQRLPALAGLARACAADIAVGDVDAAHRERLISLADTMERCRFAAPAGFGSVAVHVLGLDQRRRAWPFPADGTRMLVVSPFLTRRMLERLPCPWSSTTVVSMPHELDRELGHLAEDADFGANRDQRAWNLTPAAVDDAGEGLPALSGLHAKLFVIDQPGGRSSVFTGSANATEPALTVNVEVLVELEGATTSVGVGRFLGEEGIAPLLAPHKWGESAADDDPRDAVLDIARRALAALPMMAEVAAADDGRFDVRYRIVGDLPDLGATRLDVRPISITSWRPVDMHGPLNEVFRLDELAITAFLAVRLSAGGREQGFVVHATLTGMPDGREARLIAALLASPERLIRYLLLLLLDPAQDRFIGSTQEALDRVRHARAGELTTVPLLEVMVRALAQGSGRLAEVDRLLAGLGGGTDLIDPQLRELWSSVREAAGLTGVR